MIWNGVKSNCSLAELEWKRQGAGNLCDWDGQVRWFADYVKANPDILAVRNVKTWHEALKAVAKINEDLAEWLGLRGFI